MSDIKKALTIFNNWSKMLSGQQDAYGKIMTNEQLLFKSNILTTDIDALINKSDLLQEAIINDNKLNPDNFIILSNTGGNETDLSTHIIHINLSTELNPSSINIDGTSSNIEPITSSESFVGTLIHESQHDNSTVGRNWLTNQGIMGEFFNEATSALWQGIVAYQEEKNGLNSQFSVLGQMSKTPDGLTNIKLSSDIKNFLDTNPNNKDAEASLLAEIANAFQYADTSNSDPPLNYWQYYLKNGLATNNHYSDYIKNAQSYHITYDATKKVFSIIFYSDTEQKKPLNANDPMIIDRDTILDSKTADLIEKSNGQIVMPAPQIQHITNDKTNMTEAHSGKDPIIITDNINTAISGLDGQFSTHYDFDKKGVNIATSWIQGNSYFLVTLDNNGQPVLLGNNTESGYQMLSKYDTNGDGIINSSDAGYSQLYLWDGANIGNVESDDLYSLSEFGITSISLSQTTQNVTENDSTVISSSIVNLSNGTQLSAIEANLATDTTYTITQKDQEISSGILSTTITVTNTDGTTSTIDLTTLPDFHGYGVLSSLTASMITIGSDGNGNLPSEISETLNNTLYQDVLGLTQLDLNTTNYQTLIQSFDSFLKDWSDTGTVYEGDTGVALPDTEMYGNYRLQVLDKYLGQATYFEGHSTYISYGWPPKAYLDVAYTDLEENLVGEFFLQSQYKDLGTYISYDETNDILSFNTDASGNSYTYANLLTYANANYATAMADPTSSFYNILSDLIYGIMTSEDDNISDVFTSLATVSPEQASEILMTSEGLQIYQYNNIENINSSLIGETTYIWSGVVNEDIHQAVDTSSNYFAWDQQMLSPTDSTLLIDSNSSAISIGVTSGNTTEPDGYISFSINGYTLNVGDTVFQQLTAIDFNDNDISIENNEFVIGSNAIVLGDTSTLANNMYVLNNSIVTYNFSQNINLNSTGNYSINIDSTATFTASSFSFNGTSYTTTLNGYTLTINEIKDVEIKIEQNNKNIAYLYNGTINTSNPSKGVSSLTETISTPGSYIYNASTYTDNFDITNTTGTDTIEMAGHSGSLSENLKYTASSTGDTEMYQTSATDIQIISGDLTINLKNAFVENPNSPTYFYSDLANINNKSLINSSFNIQQSGTIAITGYVGTFTDTLLNTVTDLEIRTGTNNNITDADGHSLFIESLNGAITTGQTNMNIYVSLNPSINMGIQAQNILASATYSDGNIVWTNSYTGNTYTLMNASDFVKGEFNISFDTTQSRFGMSLGNVNLIYNISNEDLSSESSGTLLTNLLTMQNTINLTDTDNSLITLTNSTDSYVLKVERNIYNINGAGTYKIISDDYYDDININVASNIEVQESNGYIAFDYSLADATYNMDYDGNLLISQNGYTVQIDDYKDYYGAIKTVINGDNTPLSSSGNISITSSSDYQAIAYQKSNWIYTYDSDLNFSYNDEYSTSNINNQTTNSTETFNLNNSANFYSNGAGDNITVNLLQNNYFSLSGSGTYSNIALSGSNLSFTYTINSKTSNFTLTNAIDYFSNQQDVIKDTNSAFSSIDTTLVRNIMSVSTDTILSTDFNKIFATQSNITLTDNAGNNEFAINQSATDITLSSTVSGDTIILDGDYSKNTLFSVSNNILDIHNLNSSQNIYVDMSKDTNITLAFNDGKTISATNALTFAQDVSKMTVGAGSVVENILSTTDYKTVMALYNQN